MLFAPTLINITNFQEPKEKKTLIYEVYAINLNNDIYY